MEVVERSRHETMRQESCGFRHQAETAHPQAAIRRKLRSLLDKQPAIN
jgi:hypothetical protein